MLVLELATYALRQIGIIGETHDASAEQGQDAVTRLNDMMASLLEDDIDLGWNPKSTTADTVVLPLGEVDTIKSLLAVKLAGSYGVDAPPATVLAADSGYKRLLRKGLQQVMKPTRSAIPRGDAQYVNHRIETDQ
jgi:hypothetical protein